MLFLGKCDSEDYFNEVWLEQDRFHKYLVLTHIGQEIHDAIDNFIFCLLVPDALTDLNHF